MEKPDKETRVSPEEYRRFVRQIELTAIWLRESSISNPFDPAGPTSASVNLGQGEATWTPAPNGFDARVRYKFSFTKDPLGDPAEVAVIEVAFAARFESTEPLTDEIFEVFRRVNLPVNTWPYAREYVATTLGRMGWGTFTLPTFKT